MFNAMERYQYSFACTLCMGKYVAMLSLLKGIIPTGIIRLDECLFLLIGECGRLVRSDEDTRTTRTPEFEEEVLVMLHVKWVLRKVSCGKYSMSNNYILITHESMHSL